MPLRSPPRWHPDNATLLALALGLALSVAAALWQRHDNRQRAERTVAAMADAAADQIADRLASYEKGLRGARGAMIAAGLDRLTTERFQRYAASRDFPSEFPGAHGFGIIQRVPAANESAYIAAARRDGQDGFRVRQLTPHDGERWVIRWIEPLERNAAGLGLDIASEDGRRAAAAQAMRSGLATITAPLALVQPGGPPVRGFLVLLPVYRHGVPLSDAAQREAATVAWSYVPIVLDEMLDGLRGRLPPLALSIRDVTAGEPPGEFYRQAVVGTAAEGIPAQQRQRAVYGRQWRLQFEAGADLVDGLALLSPRAVLAAGGLTTLLAAALTAVWRLGRQRERLAQASRRHLAMLVDNSSDAVIGERLDGSVTSWNRAAERLFGLPAAQALGQPLARLLQPADPGPDGAETTLRPMPPAGAEAVPPYDLLCRRADGSTIEVSVSSAPINDSEGRVIGVGHTIRDIGERKLAERRLREFNAALERQVGERTAQLEAARRDLQTILDAIPSMIGYWDRHLVNRFANRAYHRWFGVDPGKLPGQRIDALLGPVLYAANRQRMEAALRGEPQTFERSIPRPDGQGDRHSLAHYLPDVVDGQVRGFYALVHDVTELTESRRRLARSEAFLERVGRVAGVGGWQLDIASGTLDWSTETRRIHEVAADYRPALDDGLSFYPPEARPTITRAVRNAIERGEGWDLELPFVTARGRRLWVRAVGEAERSGGGGAPSRLVGAFQDITARRQADEAVHRLDAALAASAAKSEFLANVSHEIRTPMNAVLGLSYLLERTALDADQHQLLDKLQVASRALLALLEDVLDLSRIEAGALHLHVAPFDLAVLVQEVAGLLRAEAEAHGLGLVVEPLPALPPTLAGDAARLRQVLTNLVANAVKFTERGEVRLRVLAHDTAADPLRLRFEVADTGIGIAPELQARLFQPFTQADTSTTRRFGGSGLGLSISRRLVRLMGGDIALSSTPGRGSLFSFELVLPRVVPAAALQDRDAPPLWLALADGPALDALAAHATRLGWPVQPVPADGLVAALDRALAGVPDGLPVPLALVADADRLQADAPALAAWRTRHARAAALPVVALLPGGTGDARPAPAQPAAVADTPGADAVLPADTDVAALFGAVAAATYRRQGHSNALQQASRPDGADLAWLPGLRVWVIDDSDINREVAQRILALEGAEVTPFADAAQALAALAARPDAVDVVLMDVQMPDMDGHDATRALRHLYGLSRLPVIALTAGALTTERQRALAAGMDDFVAKPLQPVALVQTLRRHAERRRGAPWPVQVRGAVSAGRAAPAGPFNAAATGAPADWPTLAGIDTADASQRLRGDLDLFASSLSRLLTEFGDLGDAAVVARLPTPPGPAADALRARMHKLCGSAGLIGAAALATVAKAAEDALQQTDARAAAAACQALAPQMKALRQQAEPWLAARRASLTARALPAADEPLQDAEAVAATLSTLRDLLLRRDLSALTRVNDQRATLRAALGDERFDRLLQQVDALAFDSAVALLSGAAEEVR